MVRFSFRFPQISRFFSAPILSSFVFWSEYAILWGGLDLLVAINGLSLLKTSRTNLFYLPVLLAPLSSERHMEMALLLRSKGFETLSKQEAEVAQDLDVSQAVLGAWEAEPSELRSQFTYWKLVTEEKPDYRDGFIMAASFAYQLDNIGEAQALISRAFSLDPASPVVQNLQAIIEAR